MEVVNMRDKEQNEHTYMKKQEALIQETIHNLSPPPTTTESPTHEFSFTISLNPHPPPPEPSSTPIGLSPADDIFHGHPLPIPPRYSTNSMDSFTLPIGHTFSDFSLPAKKIIQTRPKSKSFSIFSRPKWRKGSLDEQKVYHKDHDEERNKKLKLEVAQLIKRYMRVLRALMSFPKAKRSNTEFNRELNSFPGNFPVNMNRRGKLSPAKSGILLGSGTLSPAKSSTSYSTMEDLHAAIEAAIAHCKNSIAIEDKVQA